MIAHHMIILVIALIVLLVLYRWGVAIFTIYALIHFCLGQWDRAALAVCFAAFIAFVRSCVSWLDWEPYGREDWRRANRHGRLRSFPR